MSVDLDPTSGATPRWTHWSSCCPGPRAAGRGAGPGRGSARPPWLSGRGRRMAGRARSMPSGWPSLLGARRLPRTWSTVLIAALRGPGSEAALFERLGRPAGHWWSWASCNTSSKRPRPRGPLSTTHPTCGGCAAAAAAGGSTERSIMSRTLELADAVELFSRRASRRHPGRPQYDDVHEGTYPSLDGLPLAIELGGGAHPTWASREITRRLRQPGKPPPATPTAGSQREREKKNERRRSLEVDDRVDYDLVYPTTSVACGRWRRLRGWCALDAVESIHPDTPSACRPEAAIDVVDRLVNERSLVTLHDERGADGGPRYRLLDSVRAFALGGDGGGQQSEVAFESHARWFASRGSRLARARSSRRRPGRAPPLRAHRASNIDAALAG